MGYTGSGKSTWVNRICTSANKDRAELCRESPEAEACTMLAEEHLASFFGDKTRPMRIIDMPGLGDPRGPQQDMLNIQHTAKFLMERPGGHASMFVLVVNATSQRVDQGTQLMLDIFRKVFDDNGSRRFVDYVALVFTKAGQDLYKAMYVNGNPKKGDNTPEQFQQVLREKIGETALSWASHVAALLGAPDDQEVRQHAVVVASWRRRRRRALRRRRWALGRVGVSYDSTLLTPFCRWALPYRLRWRLAGWLAGCCCYTTPLAPLAGGARHLVAHCNHGQHTGRGSRRRAARQLPVRCRGEGSASRQTKGG